MSDPADPGPRGEVENAAAVAHIRGSSVLAVGRIASLGLTLTTQVLIVRELTKGDYGAFAYGLAAVVFARILVSAGHGEVHSRFLAIYEERREHAKLFGLIVMEVATILVLSAALFVVVFLARGWIGTTLVGDPAVVPVLLVMLALAPLEALDRLVESIFAVFTKPRSIFFRKYFLAPGLRLAAIVALIALDAGVLFLAVGYVVAGVVGLALYVKLLLQVLRKRALLPHPAWRRPILPIREVFTFGLPLLSGELVNLSINSVSVLLLGYFAATTEVAGYRAVYPAARLNQLVLWTFAVLFMPLAARLHARDDRPGLRDAYWRSALWVAVATFPVFALTGPLAGTTAVTLFGGDYRESGVVLAILATGYYLNASLGFNALMLQTVGRLRWLLKVNVMAALANVALSLALIPRWGAVGVALANSVTLVGQNVANQIGLRAGVGIRVFDRRGVPVYGMIVGAAAALTGFERLVAAPVLVDVAVAALLSLGLLVVNRRRLDIGATFPEIARLPVIGRLLTG